MPISTIEKQGKKYKYFTVHGSKRLYLGPADKPQKERIEEAIQYLTSKIKKYEEEKLELLKFFGEKKKKYEILYKLIFFDLDGVIFDKPWFDDSSEDVAISTWDLLFKKLEIYDAHEKLKQKFISGGFKSYMEWTEAACNVIMHFLDKKTFDDLINQRKFSFGAEEVFSILSDQQIKTVVITGSFEALAQRAKKKLGHINHILAHCKFIFKKDGLLKSWQLKETDYEHKAKFVRSIAEQHKIQLDECAFIGDDVNDKKAFKQVGLSIAFNSNKESVQQAADIVIDGRDLRLILPHLTTPPKLNK